MDEYPNTGFNPNDMPRERVEEASLESVKVTQSLPVLDDLFAWFDEQIILCDSVKNALSLVDTHKNLTEKEALVVCSVMHSLLLNKKENLQSLRDNYVK